MNNTYIDINKKSTLYIKNNSLIIEKEEGNISIPIEDISTIILNHYEIFLSKKVIELCAIHNISLITTDHKQQPVAQLIPYHGHSQQTLIFNQQIKLSDTNKGKFWKMIVKSKITNQNYCLEKVNIYSDQFKKFIGEVQYNDNTNIEAVSAKKYFNLLFGNEFRRDQDAENGINALLNYGYAILRSLVARSIVKTGLSLSIGIWHKNQFDPMPLANDLMEPLRPFVDYMIYDYIINKEDKDILVNKQFKEHIARIIIQITVLDGKATNLENGVDIYVTSIKKLILNETKSIILPRLK